MEKTSSLKEEMDGEVFNSRQTRHLSFRDNMILKLFPKCTLNWGVHNYVSRQGKSINRTNESTMRLYKLIAFCYCTQFDIINCLLMLKLFSLIIEQIDIFVTKTKNQFNLHNWQSFSLRIMATLRNKGNLTAVLRQAPKYTRNSESKNIFDPVMAEEYIAQVSEEIEGKVTRRLSKNFSRTESRNLGALSQVDEVLLNPQVRNSPPATLVM